MQTFQRIRQPADAVNQPQLHRLLAVNHTAHVGGQLPRLEHQLCKGFPLYPAVGRNKLNNAILNALKIVKGLGHADHQPIQPHRMDGHGGGRRNKGALGRHGQRHPDGMAASQHQRDRRLGHRGNQLRDSQPRLHVAAAVIQQNQQAVHLVALLHHGQQGKDVLILGALAGGGQQLVPLNLPHNGQNVNGSPLTLNQRGAQVYNRRNGLLSAQFLMPVLHLIPSLFLPVRIPRAGKFTPRRGFYFS